jgi:succinate dehydrogenase / fumarate reductase cytochrome b subunit
MHLYNSSVGQKIFLAITGLFLCTFLIVHLTGNLLLFRADNGAAFEQYSTFMSTNSGIRLMEIVLFGGFVFHILFGIRTWLYNRRARPIPYAMNRPSENSSLSSRVMFWTGSIIFIFLVIHLKTFFVPARFPGDTHPSMYALVLEAFRSPVYDAFYVVAVALMAYHLRHGFQSAFQTFGLRPGRRRMFDMLAVIFWLVIPVGFAIMPVYFLLVQ